MICPTCRADNPDSAAACARCGAGLSSPTAAVAPTAPGARPPTPSGPLIVTADLAPGTVFHGRYEILAPLGRGGMGMVVKARDTALDEIVAIKILRPDFTQDHVMAERFRSEIKVARRIRHHNVCGIHDYGEEQGLLFISMEYVEGPDLKRLIRERGAFPPDQAYDIAIQVAEGLQAVHDAGVIHRDLKSPNIMLDPSGTARLMDFGIAKRSGDGTLTATGTILGTPEYMSPEQAQGQKIDHRSDLYALGIVIYELFTGKVPFRGETPISTILKQIQDPPPLDGPGAGQLPDGLRPVLKRALSKQAAGRFSSAREMAEALRHARSPSTKQERVPTQALQAPTLQSTPTQVARPAMPARPPAVRARAWGLYASAVVTTVVIGVVAFLWRGALAPVPLSPQSAPPEVMAAPSPGPEPSLLPAPTLAPVSVTPVALPTPAPTPRADRTLAAPSPTPRPAPPTPQAIATPSPAPAATPAPAPGSLKVVAKPWANVLVDGREIGQTPMDAFELEAGPHVVRVRNPQWEPIERRILVKPGSSQQISIDFPSEGTPRR